MKRLAVLIGRQSFMPRFLPQIVWLDQTIHRLTRGRFSLLSLAGLPELFLTVPGRKSGEPRTTPLLCVPHEGGWLVAGSNWGAPKLPIWVLNLRANQRSRANVGDRTVEYGQAVELEGRERSATLVALILKYGTPAERLGRGPVFRLIPPQSIKGGS